jgi:hypothetical protein
VQKKTIGLPHGHALPFYAANAERGPSPDKLGAHSRLREALLWPFGALADINGFH